ncbi:MAG: protein kinase [Gemmataceae bacterium]
MAVTKAPNEEPIPGYRLIERLGKGGCGEVWKCEAPGGLFKAIKFVYGNLNGVESDRVAAEEELRAIERIKTIRHPFLLSMDRVENVAGELVIVSELADKNLHEVYQEYVNAGLPGIPREELVRYLREAAEVLDMLNSQHGLQHLDVKPQNLFVISKHIKVADFGLMSSIAAKSGTTAPLEVVAITPIYASPEVFQGQMSDRCDQYSLAVTYQELLTGTLPFQGHNSRQLLFLHSTAQPNLDPLTPADRSIVARALAKNPEARFESCTEFVEALVEGKILKVGRPGEVGGSSLRELTGPQQSEVDTHSNLTLTTGSGVLRRHARPKPPSCQATKGYRFQKQLTTTPFLEEWLAETPKGEEKVIKFLYGCFRGQTSQQHETLLQLQALQHPGLTPISILESSPGRIVLARDFLETSLKEHLQDIKAENDGAIPRDELLAFLAMAADTLDYLHRQHSVQHLGLNPRRMLVQNGRLLIDEFGFAELIWIPGGQPIVNRNKRYSAPELFSNQINNACDQYSLACVYLELLTGQLPGASQAGNTPPQISLELAPQKDLAALARAMDPNPQRRWTTCSEFVAVLRKGKKAESRRVEVEDEFTSMITSSKTHLPAAAPAGFESFSELSQMLTEILEAGGGDLHGSETESPPLFAPDGKSLLQQFTAGIPLGEARSKLNEYRTQLDTRLVLDTFREYIFQINLSAKRWESWVGKKPVLEVKVVLAKQNAFAPTPIDVEVMIKPVGCGSRRGRSALENLGMEIITGIRHSLVPRSEKRTGDRLLWPHPFEVCPLEEDGVIGAPIVCRGKDISLTGIGFYMPTKLHTPEVVINLPPTEQTHGISIPATLVRATRRSDGWYEVGALFRVTRMRDAMYEICLS